MSWWRARPRGWTPLHAAARAGDERAVAAAIAAGADVHAIAEGAETALTLACAAGAIAIVVRLLDAGADPDTRTRRDRTPLHLAAGHADPALVHALVARGARIVLDRDDASPLAVAIEHGHAAVLDALLARPLPWREPGLALARACTCGRVAIIRALVARFGAALLEEVVAFAPGASPIDRGTPIAHAARAGQVAAIECLIELGAAVTAFDPKDEWSALMHAADAGQPEAARALLRHGADPTTTTEWFATARAIAARRGDAAMVALLGGDPSKVTPARAAAPVPLTLLDAIRASDGDAVRAHRGALADPALVDAAAAQADPWILADLLARGAPVATPRYGVHPLERAAREGRWGNVEVLAAHAGDAADPDGARLLVPAAAGGHLRCTEVLLELGGRTPARLAAALLAAAPHPHVVAMIVRRGGDPRARGRDGDGLLHLGAREADVPIELYLRLAGADVAARGRLGWTPLHAAALAGAPRSIALLVAAGAPVDAAGDRGDTALHIACTYPRAGVVEALLAAGASVAVRDAAGATPLHAAAMTAPEPVRALLAAGADPAALDHAGLTPRALAEREVQRGDYRTLDRRRAALAILVHHRRDE